METEHFAEATTSHILRHWNYKTHKKHLAIRRIRSKTLLKSVVRKDFISHTLFAESQAFKYLIKLHQCTFCTDKSTPWMSRNDNKCETYGNVLTKCLGNKYWSRNKFCQMSCFKYNNGYEGDDCCENQTTCNICTNEVTPWMKDNNKHCSSSTLLLNQM